MCRANGWFMDALRNRDEGNLGCIVMGSNCPTLRLVKGCKKRLSVDDVRFDVARMMLLGIV